MLLHRELREVGYIIACILLALVLLLKLLPTCTTEIETRTTGGSPLGPLQADGDVPPM